MKKIMIVDDEGPIREWLEMCVEKAGEAFSVVGSFRTGEDAMDEVDDLKPDIILTDIVMPKMDGLAFLAKVKSHLPDVKVAILTSHNDFEFARTAVKQGADDYFLKTELDKDKVKELLEKLTADLDVMPRSSESAALAINLHSRGQYLRRQLDILLKGDSVLVEPEKLKQFNIDLEDGQIMAISLRHDLNELMNSNLFTETTLKNQLLFTDRSGDIIFIANICEGKQGEVVIHSLLNRLNKIVNIKGNVGVSRVYTSRQDLWKAVQDAVNMREYLFYMPNKRYDYRHQASDSLLIRSEIINFKHRIIEDHKNYGKKRSQLGIQELLAYIYKTKLLDTNFVKRTFADLMEQIAIGSEAEDFKISNLRNAIYYAGNLDMLIVTVNDFYDDIESMNRYSKNIEKAIDYILSHYSKTISLYDVASDIGFSEEYFSRLFKKEVGVNYTEFLNKVRLKEAYRLLNSTSNKINTIAQMVGINNSAYFTQLFKKEFGESPSIMRSVSKEW